MVSKEDWVLKKDGNTKSKTKVCFTIIEFKVAGEVLIAFETEFRRDERIMRFNCKS
jgi:small subunit ribosomal protein S6